MALFGRLTIFFELLKQAYTKWGSDKVSLIAAGLAFYTGLAFAPLLVFIVVLTGMFLNGPEVREQITEQVQSAVGDSGVEIVNTVLNNALDPTDGAIATLLALVTFLFSASSLFAVLEDAFNTIWKIPAEKLSGITNLIWARVKAITMVLIISILLLVNVVLSTAIGAVRSFVTSSPEWFADNLPMINETLLTRIVNLFLPLFDIGISLLTLTLLFAWMFKGIPRTSIPWRDVWGGAILTALLFIIGKFGLATYLSGGSVGSVYGAAGSLLILLVWVYYTMQIVLLGLEYTYVDAHLYGSRRKQAGEVLQALDSAEVNTDDSTDEPPVATSQRLSGLHSADENASPSAHKQLPLPQMLAAGILFLVGLLIGSRDTRRH